jgi:hypothetical protein
VDDQWKRIGNIVLEMMNPALKSKKSFNNMALETHFYQKIPNLRPTHFQLFRQIGIGFCSKY